MNRGHWPGFRWSCTFLPAGEKCVGRRPPPSRRGGAGLEENKAGGDAGLRPWDGLIDE